MKTTELGTPTASCGACANKIAGAFDDVDGVESAVLDLDTKRTAVTYDPDLIDEDEIRATLREAGYTPGE